MMTFKYGLFRIITALGLFLGATIAQAQSISGTVTNNSGMTGDMFVEAFSDPQYVNVVNGQLIPAPTLSNPYQIGDAAFSLPDGVYYLRASVDTAFDGSMLSPGEPYALSSAVTISGGVPVNNVNLSITNAIPEGIITTVAGNGMAGPAPQINVLDNYSALSVNITPVAITHDNADNIYFVDGMMGGSALMKVDGQGVISTLVPSGLFVDPAALDADAAGNIYVADNWNCQMSRVTPQGAVTVVAGNGVCGYNGDGIAAVAASMRTAWDIAVDGSGNLYIAEPYRVRKVDTNGIITTVVGDGSAPVAPLANGAMATSPTYVGKMDVDTQGNIYFEDGNFRIFKADFTVDPAGVLSLMAGGGFDPGPTTDGYSAINADLGPISSVQVDNAGNLFLSTQASLIRKVDAQGIITTIVGTWDILGGWGMQGYAGDGGLATFALLNNPNAITLTNAGTLIISDSANNRIRKINGAGTALQAWQPEPQSISGMIVNSSGLTGAIYLSLIDQMTGLPVTQGVMAAADGSYRFTNVADGLYDVNAFVDVNGDGTGPAVDEPFAKVTSISISPAGNIVKNLDLLIVPLAADPTSITGRVISASGLPVANVNVFVDSMNFPAGMSYLVTTDANGRYTILNAVPDLYYITVDSGISDPVLGWQPFPNGDQGGPFDGLGGIAVAPQMPAAFSLVAGETLSATAQLYNPTYGTAISGTVIYASGQPAVDAYVTAYPLNVIDPLSGQQVWTVISVPVDMYGNYQITGLLPGDYGMDVSYLNPTTGFPEQYFPNGDMGGQFDGFGQVVVPPLVPKIYTIGQAQAIAGVDAQLYNPSYTAPISATISGTIAYANSSPVIDAYVTAYDVYAIWDPNLNMMLPSPVTVLTDVYGNFTLGLAQGTYSVSVGYQDPYTGVTSSTFPNGEFGGVVDQYGQVFDPLIAPAISLISGDALQLGMVSLLQAGDVSGVISDPLGLPIANAYVYITGGDAPTGAVTNASGAYVISGLNPFGSYQLHVSNTLSGASSGQVLPNGGLGGDWDGAVGLGAATTFSGNKNIVANIQLPAGIIINATVLSPTGLPVSGLRVETTSVNSMFIMDNTDANGFVKLNIPVGNKLIVDQYNSNAAGLLGGYVDVNGLTTTNLANARVFNEAAGSTVNITVTMQQGVLFTGTVSNPGTVAVTSWVRFYDSYGNFVTSALAVPNYSKTLAAGSYRIKVEQALPATWTGGWVTKSNWLTPDQAYGWLFNVAPGDSAIVNVQLLDYVTDRDGDGVLDWQDAFPDDAAYSADADLDHLADAWEIANFGDLITADQFTDFNGNGVLDINEFTNGTNPKAVVSTGSVKNDFDGDGKSDIFWRNMASGKNAIWQMNGTAVSTVGLTGTMTSFDYFIAGTGDFNGDGISDIFWRNVVSGKNAIWLMNGTTVATVALTDSMTNFNYVVAGVGDFDGDGKSDILWRNTVSGKNAIWLMNGTTVASVALTDSMTSFEYVVAGVTDFDGDGKSDIFWRNMVSGKNAIWLMNGTTVASVALTNAMTSFDYVVAGIGDYDGDGKSDILWRNTVSGKNAIWLMNGTTVATVALTDAMTSFDYVVAGAGDYDGDGKSDVLWRNMVSGKNAIWLMNGTTVATVSLTNAMTSFDYVVINR